jgi:glycosyltransferase involved in cell wall biosynthesis
VARLLYVVNDGAFFMRHRGMLARAARDAGHDVHVATPLDGSEAAIEKAGFVHHPLRLVRSGRNAVAELRALIAMVALFRAVRPNLVHLVTIKPVLYGGLAARLTGVPAAVFAISGLGYVFLATGLAASLLRALVWIGYRLALGHANARVIFQNEDDRALFVDARAVARERTAIVPGNGIDLTEFHPSPEPVGVPLVVLPARMLWDKGVREFVEAARELRRRGVAARFALVGPTDPANPAAITEAELRRWQAAGDVEWWGTQSDMPSVYAAASIVCLPSYREGIPRSLIEAAACGRPIVATDVPGCRDVVQPGQNGLLVPPRSALALADALRILLASSGLRSEMGHAGRDRAERELGPEAVIGKVLTVYAVLTDLPAPPALAA